MPKPANERIRAVPIVEVAADPCPEGRERQR